MKSIQTLMLSVSCAAMASAVPAYGQQEPQEGAAAEGLGVIVVTAQRKSEDVQKAAIPINVVSANDLAVAGAADTTVLNKVAPSLFITRGGGTLTSFFIRGVGNFSNNSFSDPAVAFNYDGVYIARPTATATTFFDLQRIEVLKGPQGTLYGRNATGGAVNLIPAKPKLGDAEAAVSMGYGNAEAIDAEAMVNVPLAQNAALRLAGRIMDNDGYNADGTDDSNVQAVRGQLYWEGANLNIRLAADYSHLGGLGAGASFNGAFRYAPGAPASASAPANYVYTPSGLDERSGFYSPEGRAYFANVVNAGPFNNPAPIDLPFIDNENWGVHAEANLDSSLGTFTFVPAYREGKVNNRFSGPAFRAGWTVEDTRQTSFELRLDGKRLGPVDWLVGAIYFDEHIDSNASFNQYAVQNIQDFTLSNKAWAAFGRVILHAGDRLRLTGGMRYTRDKKTISANTIAVINQCTVPVIPPNFAPCAGGASLPSALSLADLQAAIPAADLPAGFPAAPYSAVPFGPAGNILLYVPGSYASGFRKGQITYRVGVEADILDNSLAYISYESGYRSGGFNLTYGHETFAPEYIKAFTVGLKNRLFDNRVILNVEGFYWRYRNQQLAHLGLDNRGSASFFTENIGRSKIWGVDVDATIQIRRNTVLTGAVQYLDTETADFIYTVPDTNNLGIPPATTCPSTDSGAVFTVDCSGNPLLNSPKWSINAGLDQTFELGDHKIVVNVSGRYRSNRMIGFDYLPQQNSGGTFEADASLQFGQIDDRWTITGWVRNLTNENIPTLAQYNSISGGVLTTAYQPPRTYGVKAAFRF